MELCRLCLQSNDEEQSDDTCIQKAFDKIQKLIPDMVGLFYHVKSNT